MHKYLLFFSFIFLMLPCSTRAAQWIDVTSKCVVNPSFAGNSNKGWTYTTNAGSKAVRVESMEFWQGVFNIYQTISNLPKGKYRLSVQAYYRCRDNNTGYRDYQDGNEDITAYLYAGTNKQKLASIYSSTFTENLANQCWSTYDFRTNTTIYVPNTMESAQAAFQKGCYNNQMVFQHDGGNINIGLINEHYQDNNWCIFDNFKLEYYGEVTYPTQLSISTPSTHLIVGEQTQIQAAFTPNSVTYTQLSYTSSNSGVATVSADGTVTAVGEGTAVITATTTDGSNLKAQLTLHVQHNAATTASLVINEVMSGNIDQFISPYYDFDGWVELYNPTDKGVELSGLKFAADNTHTADWTAPDNMGIIPAHGYKVVWFNDEGLSSTAVNFKLDTDGGQLYIFGSNGEQLATVEYPAATSRTSYCRTTDGGSTWALSGTPTPGQSNNGASYAAKQLAAPEPSEASQLFSGSLSVNVPIPDGATLRYTTNGELPTLTTGKTSADGNFSFASTTVLRLRLFANNMLPSDVTTRSYILKDKDYTLPVLSVVADSDFLYSDSIGVMVKGVNGVEGNGQSTPCNWNMPWERPVNFSYIPTTGNNVFTQDAMLEMAGGWSRAWTPHSFKLKGNKKFNGIKQLNYPFFQAKPYIRNRTLQIRNGGNDTQCRIKDAALQTIVQTSGIDVDLQSYQPAHEFINGKYIGVLNMREPNNKHYVYANYGWDDDEIDQFEMSPDSGYVQKAGTKDAFDQLVTLSADAANNSTYEEIKRQLDIDEYINYMATELYLGNVDWPQNNIKGFRHKADDGKFRFVLYDLDGSLSTTSPFTAFANKQTYTFDKLYNSSVSRYTKEIEMVTLFLNLLNNSNFRKQFIDTYCIMGGSVFDPTRSNEIIDSLVNRVQSAMAIEGTSPNSTANTLKSRLSGRNATMTSALQSYSGMQLSSSTARTVKLASNAPGARITINNLEVPTGAFNGYLFLPATIKAVAPAGYTFKGWQSASSTGTTVFAKGSTWNYYDQGSLDHTGWNGTSYSTSAWSSGSAPLGYGHTGMGTTLQYGSDASDKRPTYYFRRSFTLGSKPTTDLTLNYTVDDGFVVYVNGTEAARYNMPTGTVQYSTFATTYAQGNPDQGSVSLAASLFKKGTNTIAVEVHNNSLKSSDICWDAQLVQPDGNSSLYSTADSITLPAENISLTAVYESMDADSLKAQGINPVRINEISTGNDRYVNDYYKKADWIELYNTTGSDIDLEGMYLSTDEGNKHKYQITAAGSTASTIIPAHGYKIIWCDKQEPLTELHASFKLPASAGKVLLTAANDSYTDVFSYTNFDASHSEGRYPDGGNKQYVMDKITIGQANVLSTYAAFHTNDTYTGISAVYGSSAQHFYVGYAAGNLIIESPDAARYTVKLYTVGGQLVKSLALNVNRKALVDVTTLPQGCYIAVVSSNGNNRVARKFER